MKPRLLVVELHHLGDAVLSLPFVRGARSRFEVHVLCRPASREVYALLADPPHVHAWEPPWADGRPCGAWQAATAAREEGIVLRPLEFSAAACVWPDARAGILMAAARAGRRVGFPMTRANCYAADAPWRRRRRWAGCVFEIVRDLLRPGAPLLTDPLRRESPRQPHLRCWEQVAAALGFTCDDSVPWIPAPPRPARGPRPVLAVHAHARVPSKQWPAARWRELLAAPAVTDRFDVVEILPAGAEPLRAAAARAVPTPDLASLVGALQGADALVCHDSLPAHLAAALGKPVVAIFGSGEPDWFAPWNNRDRAVQRRVCPLHPCIDRCGMDSFLCLEAVGTADVLAQVQRLASAP